MLEIMFHKDQSVKVINYMWTLKRTEKLCFC